LTSDRTSSPSLTVGLRLAVADERGVWGADRVSKNWRQETDGGLSESKSKSLSKSIRRVTNDRFWITAESALRLLTTLPLLTRDGTLPPHSHEGCCRC